MWERKEAGVYILLYVDDIIIAGNNKSLINQIKKKLRNKFRMKDLGKLQSFLGIDIEKSDTKLRLNQSNYSKKLLERFKMEDCNPIRIPMDTTSIPDSEENL